MNDSIITHVIHDCQPPGIHEVPRGEHSVIAKWRCPKCRQLWRITSTLHSSQAETYGRNRRKRKVRK